MKYDISDCTNYNLILTAELRDTRRKLAELLLKFQPTPVQNKFFSQNEMASTLGTSWDMVNNSLISLKAVGAIRIDRNRMAINKNELQKILVSTE